MSRNSTQVRVLIKDLPDLKNIKNEISKKWGRKASYPDVIRFLIKEYQRNYPGGKT